MPYPKHLDHNSLMLAPSKIRLTLKLSLISLLLGSVSACQSLNNLNPNSTTNHQTRDYHYAIYQDLVKQLDPYYGFANTTFSLARLETAPSKSELKPNSRVFGLSPLEQALYQNGAKVCLKEPCPTPRISLSEHLISTQDFILLKLETDDLSFERLYANLAPENSQDKATKVQAIGLSPVSLRVKNPNFAHKHNQTIAKTALNPYEISVNPNSLIKSKSQEKLTKTNNIVKPNNQSKVRSKPEPKIATTKQVNQTTKPKEPIEATTNLDNLNLTTANKQIAPTPTQVIASVKPDLNSEEILVVNKSLAPAPNALNQTKTRTAPALTLEPKPDHNEDKVLENSTPDNKKEKIVSYQKLQAQTPNSPFSQLNNTMEQILTKFNHETSLSAKAQNSSEPNTQFKNYVELKKQATQPNSQSSTLNQEQLTLESEQGYLNVNPNIENQQKLNFEQNLAKERLSQNPAQLIAQLQAQVAQQSQANSAQSQTPTKM